MQEWKGYSGDEGVRRCGAPSRVDVSLNNPTIQVVFFVHRGILCTQGYSLYTGVFFVHGGVLCTRGYALYTGACFVHRGVLCTQGYALYTGVSFFFSSSLFFVFCITNFSCRVFQGVDGQCGVCAGVPPTSSCHWTLPARSLSIVVLPTLDGLRS